MSSVVAGCPLPYAGWRRVVCTVASLVLAVGALFFTPSVALAHDELVGSQPEDGETLQAAPEDITLTFSGEIASLGAQVVVTGPDGEVSAGDPRVEGVEVVQPVAPDAPAGDYTVVWRVTSQDGHPISGELDYAVAAAPTPAADDAGQTSDAPADDAVVTSAAPDATVGPERAASTDAVVPPATEPDEGGGTPAWVWVVLAGALAALAAVVAVAVRRR
jgi:methionine-rich copper-binding protein CopC